MFTKLFGFAIVVTPLLIPLSGHAQSWKDWTKQNPTYQAPAAAESPSKPDSSNPAADPSTSWSNFSPSRQDDSPIESNPDEYFSTQNPLFEQQFLLGCQQDKVPLDYCQCALRQIQDNFTFHEVLTIIGTMEQNGEIPSEIIDVFFNCLPG